ncbi:MAG: ATP-binding protein [Pseudomonadales bacterium]|nr:ATP-binding protein [Pseudomonadales bacterium]
MQSNTQSLPPSVPKSQPVILKRSSLKFRLTALLIALGLALSVSSMAVLWFQARPLIEKEDFELNRQIGENIIVSLGQQIRQVESITSQLAAVGATIGNTPSLVHKIIPEILNYQDLRHVVAGGGIWPEPNQFDPEKTRDSYFWGRNHDGSLTFYDDYNDPKSTGYHNEEWYTPAKMSPFTLPYWSRSYIDPYSLQPMVTCTVPMIRDGKFIGVATVDLMLEGIARLIQKKTQPYGGYAFVVDRNNRFISYPIPNRVRTTRASSEQHVTQALTTQEFTDRWPLFSPINEILNNVNSALDNRARKEGKPVEELASKIESDSYQINFDEAIRIAESYFYNERNRNTTEELARITVTSDTLINEPATISFFMFPGTSWKLVTVFPLDNTIASATNITRQLALFSIIFIVACMAGAYLFLRETLFRRLKTMQKDLEFISSHASEAIPLPETSHDELGQITYWFNRRTKALSEAFDSLTQNNQRLAEENANQKHTAKLLREANATQQAILDNANLAILTIGISGKITTCSKGTFEVIGFKAIDLIGKDFNDTIKIKLYRDSTNGSKLEYKDLISNSGETNHQHKTIIALSRHRDGSWIDSSISVSEIRESGQLTGRLVIITDTSKQKEIETELKMAKDLAEQNSKAKTNFLASMSHELRTPMNAIIGFTKRLEKSLQGKISDRHMDALGTIGRSAAHLLSLINDLLDISKIEEGKLHVTASKFSLNQLIIEIFEQTHHLLISSEVKYTYQLPQEDTAVFADQKQVTQIILNLVSNAIKATERGLIEVTITKEKNHFKVKVADTGKGMSPFQLKQLFEKFTQFDTYAFNQYSTGLGLYLTNQFVEMHHGNISVNSDLGVGTTFTVTLPIIYHSDTDISQRSVIEME